MNSPKIYPRKWEEVNSYPYFFRLQVPGGWLVAVELHETTSVCFSPDPNHEWILEQETKENR